MATDDDAQWALLGEGIIAFARRRRRRLMPLPRGLHRIPGPVVILAERFVDSPVGPFMSLAIGEPVRLGLRPGLYFGTSVLNSPEARRLGRRYWGFPHELGTLRWNSEVGSRSVVWEERGIEVRARISGRPLPMLMPIRSIQQRTDGPVVVPARLRSLARRSRVEVLMEEDDPLLSLAGRHRGLCLSGMLLRRSPARRAHGWLATLRAPVGSPEPGVVGMESATSAVGARAGLKVQWRPPRAYSSVG